MICFLDPHPLPYKGLPGAGCAWVRRWKFSFRLYPPVWRRSLLNTYTFSCCAVFPVWHCYLVLYRITMSRPRSLLDGFADRPRTATALLRDCLTSALRPPSRPLGRPVPNKHRVLRHEGQAGRGPAQFAVQHWKLSWAYKLINERAWIRNEVVGNLNLTPDATIPIKPVYATDMLWTGICFVSVGMCTGCALHCLANPGLCQQSRQRLLHDLG